MNVSCEEGDGRVRWWLPHCRGAFKFSGGPSFYEENSHWGGGLECPGWRGGLSGPPHCRLCEAISGCPSLRPDRSAHPNKVKMRTTKHSLMHRSIWALVEETRRRQWHPTPAFLPGESHGRGSLVGCHLWGRSHRVGHDWSDLAAAAAVEETS